MSDVFISYCHGKVCQLRLFPLSKFETTTFEEDATMWERATGVKFFCDGLFSAMIGRKFLDVVKLDKELERKYGIFASSEYAEIEPNLRQCLSHFILDRFGEDIHFIFNKWIIEPQQLND